MSDGVFRSEGCSTEGRVRLVIASYLGSRKRGILAKHHIPRNTTINAVKSIRQQVLKRFETGMGRGKQYSVDAPANLLQRRGDVSIKQGLVR